MEYTYSSSVLSSVECAHEVHGAVRSRLRTWGAGELADDAGLVLEELVSNAVRHGRPPVRVTVSLCCGCRGRTVRVEVADAGHTIDVELVRARWRHPSFWMDEGGRGLFLVDALTSAWGDRVDDDGHTVWADMMDRRGADDPGPLVGEAEGNTADRPGRRRCVQDGRPAPGQAPRPTAPGGRTRGN
ncbi:ATP-binding protein [Streptomyces sp. NPDC051207]|uniref:ATP-binding protein n=1 Tax=Streptomyces sp. NPDC051207 TaxID=3154641 RepID=UPI003414C256